MRQLDLGRIETLGAELQQLEDELARALGLGGRARRIADPVERARKSVYNRIQAALKNLDAELPETVTLTVWDDRSNILRDRIQLLTRNAWMGFVLVLLVLGLFL